MGALSLEDVLQSEGVGVATGYAIDDLMALPLGPWPRLGCPAAYTALNGGNGYLGAILGELPRDGSTNRVRHLFENVFLVLAGTGWASIWGLPGEETMEIKLRKGTLFSPPLNSPYQINAIEGPLRFVGFNNLPMMFNIFRNMKVLFETDRDFPERVEAARPTPVQIVTQGDDTVAVGSFIDDVYELPLLPSEGRGQGYRRVGLSLSGNGMRGHIGSLETGTYKRAHRHAGGAHLVILAGTGFSVMWPPSGGDLVRIDWGPNAMIAVPEGWFHTHCNTGPVDARVVAIHRGFFGLGPRWRFTVSTREGGDQLDYEDEPPELRRMYGAELRKHGVASRMRLAVQA